MTDVQKVASAAMVELYRQAEVDYDGPYVDTLSKPGTPIGRVIIDGVVDLPALIRVITEASSLSLGE